MSPAVVERIVRGWSQDRTLSEATGARVLRLRDGRQVRCLATAKHRGTGNVTALTERGRVVQFFAGEVLSLERGARRPGGRHA